jgi:hypothetical protein
MEKPSNDNRTTGRPFDIDDEDLYRNETDRELHDGKQPDALDPDDLPSADAVKAALKYGRDSYVVKSDVDPDEDNTAPGIREQP